MRNGNSAENYANQHATTRVRILCSARQLYVQKSQQTADAQWATSGTSNVAVFGKQSVTNHSLSFKVILEIRCEGNSVKHDQLGINIHIISAYYSESWSPSYSSIHESLLD